LRHDAQTAKSENADDRDSARGERHGERARLTREQFERRFRERFRDPAFDAVDDALDAVIGVAWQAYEAQRKSLAKGRRALDMRTRPTSCPSTGSRHARRSKRRALATTIQALRPACC
jgi:hypothetical protein